MDLFQMVRLVRLWPILWIQFVIILAVELDTNIHQPNDTNTGQKKTLTYISLKTNTDQIKTLTYICLNASRHFTQVRKRH